MTRRSLLTSAYDALTGDTATCMTDTSVGMKHDTCYAAPSSSSTPPEPPRAAKRALERDACDPELATMQHARAAHVQRPPPLPPQPSLPPQHARTRKPWVAMSKEELLPLLRAERERADALATIVAWQRARLKQAQADLARGREDAVRVAALRVELRAERRSKADRQRHDLIDQATVEFKAAGRRDMFQLFAKAIVSGRMPPTCHPSLRAPRACPIRDTLRSR